LKSDLQERLLQALARCIRPIASLLLGAGIRYEQFEDVAKRAFVAEALGEPDLRGRTINTSRIAVRTGLSRKEVSRLKQVLDGAVMVSATTDHIVRPARVLQLWHSDSRFLEANGNPVDLPFDQESPSFSDLARLVGGDIPAGALRAELLAAGGIQELPNGKLRVEKRFFIPSALDEDLIVGFAMIVAPMLETLKHNLTNPDDAFIQRVAYSDHLPASEVAALKQLSYTRSAELIQSIDEWISLREIDVQSKLASGRRVGVGVFYFDNDPMSSA
jgi:hypothetical protein